MKSLYFCMSIDEEKIYSIPTLISEMKERQLSEVNICKAVREVKSDYFYCKAIGEVFIKESSCGKECDIYEARNGKSGCCKHYGFCYEPSDKNYVLNINGKLSSIQ